jgi:hypothetical protein
VTWHAHHRTSCSTPLKALATVPIIAMKLVTTTPMSQAK